MCPITLFMAVALMGAEVGWQPLPEGGVEYIIEINPDSWESLQSGQAIQSDIPPAVLREIRSYRIIVGNKKLPRQLPPRPTPMAESPAGKGVTPASKPLPQPPAQPVQSASGANSAAADASADSAQKPWAAHWLTAVALFASLAGNLFLGWIGWDARKRYRALLPQAGN
jgi:hypothetical protein